MTIIQTNDLVLMGYIVKVKDGTVTEADRKKVINVVDDFDTYLAVFNDLMYIAKSSVVDEELTIQAAFNLVATEYGLLEFDQYIPFSYLENVVYLSINILHVNSLSSADIWDRIAITIDRLQNYGEYDVVHDLYYFMITLINSYGIAISNLDVTKQILDKIESFHDEEIVITKLPPYLIGF